jgi:hypothetical protein
MNEEPKSTKPRLSWRKEKQRYGPETRRLSRGGKDWLAIAQRNKDGSWFWYGGGQNTCSTPTDLETAKKEAVAHILALGGDKPNNP